MSDLARRLFDEHAAGTRFSTLPGLADEAAAYITQAAYVTRLCERDETFVAGYKIGLTSRRMQEFCGIDHPIAGFVLKTRVHRSGITIQARNFGRLGVEFEIAVRIGQDLPARAKGFDIETVAGAIEAVAPAMELVDDRNADYAGLDVLSLVADNSWNAGIVLGEFQSHWPDLAGLKGTVFENGVEVDKGTGRDVLGHPVTALHWLANHLARQGGGLRKGDVVMTGSLVTTRFPRTGAFRFDLGGIGSVALDVLP